MTPSKKASPSREWPVEGLRSELSMPEVFMAASSAAEAGMVM